MNWFEVISLILNFVLSTGFIVTLVTLRSVRKQEEGKALKAVAEARTTELENVEAAIKIWRSIGEEMSEKYDKVLAELDRLRKEVNRLNTINNKIVKLLDRITPENLETIVEQIKSEIHNGQTTDHNRNNRPDVRL